MDHKNKKHKLNKKLIFSFTIIVLLGIVIIGGSVNLIIKNKFATYVSYENEQKIEKIIENVKYLYRGGRFNINKIEEIGIDSLNKGMLLDIYDKNNNLLWSAMEYDMSMCHQVLDDIQRNMNSVDSKWNEEYREEKFELNKNGENIGYINIGYYGSLYYLDNELDFLTDINKVIIGVAIISILISIVISIIIANSIAKPISKVSKMSKVIENGNCENKIEYKGNIKEIDDLINSINSLAMGLNKQETLRKRLTTDVAHELRTPLTSIQTHLEAILDGVWEPTNSRINGINEEVIRLVSLVNRLQNLSKIENSNEQLNIEKVNISSLVENIIYNFQSKSLDKNIDIKYDLGDLYADIDKEKISQVLVNLISNAIRYTNDDGQIDVILRQDRENTYIHVIDNGIGIPEGDLNNVFERFYRVDKSRSKSTGGMGVGLTISKAVVKAHGGDISVKSSAGVGSEFIVRIPFL